MHPVTANKRSHPASPQPRALRVALSVALASAALGALGTAAGVGSGRAAYGASTTLPPPSEYVAAPSPYRICDTRPANTTQCVNKTMHSGATLNVTVAGVAPPGGGTDVPANATAAVLNVTATNTTAVGYFTIYPQGSTRPASSNLNWTAADSTIANLVQAPLANGGVTAYLYGGSADLVIDVEGWFVPATVTGGSLYTPITPVRVCDTRTGNGTPCAGHKVVAGTPLTAKVAGLDNIPAGATAVVVNVTTVYPSRGGWITEYPAGTAKPLASNQNFPAGAIRPARVVATASAADPGHISIALSAGTADMIVDVNGYYLSSTTSAGGSAFYPLPIARIVDTRCEYTPAQPGCVYEFLPAANAGLGTLAPGDSVASASAVGVGEVPSWASAVALNMTVVPSNANGYLTVYPAAFSAPPVISDSNWTARDRISANMTVVGLGSTWVANGVFDFYVYGQSDVIADLFGFYGPLAPSSNPIVVVPATLPSAVPGTTYAATITAAGGSSIFYTWTKGAGFPPGLTFCNAFGPACGISGVPVAGDYSFSVTASDGAGHSASATVKLRVGPPAFGTPQRVGTAPVVMNTVSCASASFCVDGGPLTSTWNGSTWSTPAEVDLQAGFGGVSCVSGNWCMAVDTSAQALTYDAYTGWSKPVSMDPSSGAYGLTGVSCTSSTGCWAVDDNGHAIEYNGSWQAPVMIDPSGNGLGYGMAGISCASTSFCLATDRDGRYFTFDGTVWSARGYVDQGMSSLSCASNDWCMGVDTAGNALTYNGGGWTAQVPIDSGFVISGVSCATTSFCEAVDIAGRAMRYDGGTWSGPALIDVDKHGLYALSCSPDGFCAAVAHTTIEYEGGNWVNGQTIPGTENTFLTVSCPAVQWCMAVTNSGEAISMQGRTWSAPVEVEPALLGFMALSCPTTDFCVAVDNGGNIWDWLPSGWQQPFDLDPAHSLTAVSCAAAWFCAVGDKAGDVSVSTAGIWSALAHVDAPGGSIDAISCPKATRCVAVDDLGNEITYSNGTWSAPAPIDTDRGPGNITGVSCATVSFCVAVDFADQAIVYSGGSWAAPVSLGPSFVGFASVSCPAPDQCMTSNWIGDAQADEGGVWQPTVKIDGNSIGIPSVSCPLPTYCVAGDDVGNGITTP